MPYRDALLAVRTELRPQLHDGCVISEGAPIDLLMHQGRHCPLADREVIEDSARRNRRSVRSDHTSHRINHLDAISVRHSLHAQLRPAGYQLVQRLLHLLLDVAHRILLIGWCSPFLTATSARIHRPPVLLVPTRATTRRQKGRAPSIDKAV